MESVTLLLADFNWNDPFNDRMVGKAICTNNVSSYAGFRSWRLFSEVTDINEYDFSYIALDFFPALSFK